MTRFEDLDEPTPHCKKLVLNLQSEEKSIRKQAFLDLQKFLSKDDFKNEHLHSIFNEIQMYLFNGLRDKSEPVREQAIKFIHFLFIEKLPLNDYYISYLIPVLVERIGSPELIEESEEIRLKLVELLEGIIVRFTNDEALKFFLPDFTKILCETVKDKYPSLKIQSCHCIVLLARAHPRDFHEHAEELIKPILTAFNHQRFKVRVEAIKCIDEVVLHCTYKGLDLVVTPLAERLFDQIALVRRTVGQVAAHWLLEYRDRYSFWHKLLPLILTGLIDEVPETREEAHELWAKVGEKYLVENEADLKDEVDFNFKPPKYYAPNLKRPNLGCRALVQRNVSKIVPGIAKELGSWQQDVRVRCSQLLCAIALHVESGFTQSMQNILPSMYTAARDEDNRVVVNIVQASELMGLFISVDTWKKLVLPVVEDGPHYGHLSVLAGLIRGAPREYVGESLYDVAKVLADEDICQSRKKKYQRELLKCVRAIQEKLTQNFQEIGECLFFITVTLIALKDKENPELTVGLIDDLVAPLKVENTYKIWSAYLPNLLRAIKKDPRAWTLVTPERCIFEVVLLESREAFGENLPEIGEILVKSLDVDCDPESRLKTFIALSTAFKSDSIFKKAGEKLPGFILRLVNCVFVPSLVWIAGQTAEALRTMAASCLYNALNAGAKLFEKGVFRPIADNLIPLLISLSEDLSPKSRELALENLVSLKAIANELKEWTIGDLIKVYPEIVKRLDDPTYAVRICAVGSLSVLFETVPEVFGTKTYKAHHELLVDTLLVHFDDDEAVFQDGVLEVLKILSIVCKEVLLGKIEKHKGLLRNRNGCAELVRHVEHISI